MMHEHMKGWVGAGHKVTLFSSRFPGSAKNEILDDVEIIRGGYQYLGVQWAGFLYYLKDKDKYDFVVDQFHGIPFFTPLYVRKLKLAVIQEAAQKVWFLNPLPWPLNWIVGAIGYFSEPLLFVPYRWTHFMTGSESAKEDISRFGVPLKNITVIPHGVILHPPKPLPKKEKIKTIIYLGVLSKDKGIEDALRCFALLAKNGRFRYWVVGKPETPRYKKRLEAMVKELQIDQKVKFLGFVAQEEKFKLLAKAHVLINPSVHEGWGLVNIEANSVRTPVVAYRAKGLIDSIKDGQTGILCRTNSPEELTKNIYSLLKNNRLYESLQNGAFSWSKEFSWEKSCVKGLKLIEEVSGFIPTS